MTTDGDPNLKQNYYAAMAEQIHDTEKGFHHNKSSDGEEKTDYTLHNSTVYDTTIGSVQNAGKSTSWAGQIRRWIRTSGAEEGGIERVPTELRTDQSPRDLFSLFMSANVGTVSCI